MKVKIKQQYLLNGHRGSIYRIFPGKTASVFYSCGGDGWIVQWDLNNLKDGVLIAKDEDNLLTAEFVDDRIFAGTLQGNVLEIFLNEHEAAKKWQTHQRGVYALWAAKNDYFYSGGANGQVSKWKVSPTLRLMSNTVSAHKLRRITSSPENSTLLVLDSVGLLIQLDKNDLSILSEKKISDSANFCFANWGETLFIGGMDAQIRSLSYADFTTLNCVPAHWFAVYDLQIHPFYPIMASASRDKTIRIWKLPQMELLLTIREHMHSVNALLWSADGSLLISGGDDRIIRCFELIVE
jgi:WD40 repeat protein